MNNGLEGIQKEAVVARFKVLHRTEETSVRIADPGEDLNPRRPEYEAVTFCNYLNVNYNNPKPPYAKLV
jgi:hypothetical protein